MSISLKHARLYTHHPTNPEDANPDDDRTIYFGGGSIGRAYLSNDGEFAGQWVWNGEWQINNHGSAGTKREALEQVKAFHQQQNRCIT